MFLAAAQTLLTLDCIEKVIKTTRHRLTKLYFRHKKQKNSGEPDEAWIIRAARAAQLSATLCPEESLQ